MHNSRDSTPRRSTCNPSASALGNFPANKKKVSPHVCGKYGIKQRGPMANEAAAVNRAAAASEAAAINEAAAAT